MFITAKHSKVSAFLFQQTSLSRVCNDDHLITLSLKRCLSNRGYVDKQVIRPGLVYRALAKLVEVNPLHQNIQINLSWENVSQDCNPELWNILTDENHKHVEGEIVDSDEDIEGNDHAYEKEVRDSVLLLPTVLHNTEGPSVSPAQVLNKAPGEGQIPVSFITEPIPEALAFPKDFPYGQFHFGNTTREMPITPSQYIHAHLKCFDNRFAESPIYIFHTLDWTEQVAISNSKNIFERKQFQEDITAGKVNSATLQNILSADIMKASFKGTLMQI